MRSALSQIISEILTINFSQNWICEIVRNA